MKVRVNDIPPRGLEVSAAMDLQSLEHRLGEGEGGGKGFRFLSAPVADLLITKTSHGGLVTGVVRGRYEQPCALCTDNVARDLDLAVEFLVRERPADASEDDAEYQDDVGVFHFSGDQVDLERILQEVIILSLSIYWHPPLDAQGACGLCGRQFGAATSEEKPATGQSLGALLRKVGVKVS